MRFFAVFGVVFVLASAPAYAQGFGDECTPIVRPEPSLAGTNESLCWANWRSELEGVPQIRTAEERSRMIKSGELLNLATVPHVRVNSHQLREDEFDKRHLYGWALERLADLAARYFGGFGKELLLNSAHRTVEEQLALMARSNGNAVDVLGPKASPHMRPVTVDIARTDGIPGSLILIPRRERTAIERWLLQEERKDCLEATREKNQAVYHVTFFRVCGLGIATIRDEALFTR